MPDVEEMPQEQMDSSSSGQDGSPAPAGPQMAPPGAMPAPPQQPPVQVVAANPKAHLFSSLLNVLGGGNQTQYSVDPQTGSMQSISVPQTKGQLAKHILAGVISGMAAGESRPQPGREISQGVMRGAAAQQQQKAQQDLQARQNATEDYNRQQQSKVRQMQTVEANLRMHQVALQNGRLDKQLHDEAGAGYQDSIDSYTDSGQVVNDNATGQEAMDVQKYPVGDYLRIPKPNSASQRTNDQGKPVFRTPDGQITTEDGNGNQPLYDSRYVIVNANARTPLRASTSEQTGENSTTKTPVPGKEGLLPWVRQAQDYGIGGPQFVKATNMSGDMPAAAATSIQHQVAGLNSLAGELDNFAKKTGQQWKDADGNLVDSKTYLKAQLKSNPGLLKSIDQWRRTSAGDSTEPDIQILDKMDADPKAKSAKSDMIQLFGGGAVLQDYKDKRLATTAATKVKADTEARVAAEAATPEGKARLQNEQLNATEKTLQIQKVRHELDQFKAQGDTSLTGPAYLNSLPTDAKSLVTEIGTGKMALNRLDYLASKNPQVLESVARAFPDFDSSKIKSYTDTYKDFTSGKTSQELVAGGTALLHLNELKALNTNLSRVIGTPDHQRFENKVETVAPELARFYGNNTEKGIESYKKTLQSFFNRDAAIETQAKSMGDRLDNYEQKWKNAAPSSAYQAPLPGISDAARKARASLDPEFAARDAGHGGVAQSSSSSGGVSPEGTVVSTPNGNMVKRGGQWVKQ